MKTPSHARKATIGYRICVFSIYASLPLTVIFLYVRMLNPSDVREFRYSVGRPSAAISKFFPASRLAKESDGLQKISEEPIYFTVRYPREYETVSVALGVENPAEQPWKLGLLRAGDTWSYELASPDTNGAVQFNLKNAQIRQNSLRFIVSVPELDQQTPFWLKSVSIIYHGRP